MYITALIAKLLRTLRTTPTPPAPIAPYKVVCRYTGNTLVTGTRASCRAYVAAFGLCHVAPNA